MSINTSSIDRKIKKGYILIMNKSLVYEQIKNGIKKYFKESGFKKAAIGLSGGVDSTITALLVSDALGKDNLSPIFMPTEFTLEISKKNAYKFCKNLKFELIEIDITDIIDKYLETLGNKFIIKGIGIPEENLQARIRGNLLMWFANRNRALIIATGNRSEILTGYCTLYGDTVGAIAPIGALYKTEVYEIAYWINKERNNIIPPSILEQEPSAELNLGQKDEDDLHPYEVLDSILKLYEDESKSIEDIVNAGFKKEVVEDIVSRIKINIFKRKQLPPVIELTK